MFSQLRRDTIPNHSELGLDARVSVILPGGFTQRANHVDVLLSPIYLSLLNRLLSHAWSGGTTTDKKPHLQHSIKYFAIFVI